MSVFHLTCDFYSQSLIHSIIIAANISLLCSSADNLSSSLLEATLDSEYHRCHATNQRIGILTFDGELI